MNYTLSFEIPQLPKSVNQQTSMHWTVKGKYVREWHSLVALCVGARKPALPLKRARLTLERFSSVEPDFDGLVSSFKPVVDGLIVCGVLENDKVSNIGQPVYIWHKVKPKAGKVSVRVEEVVCS